MKPKKFLITNIFSTELNYKNVASAVAEEDETGENDEENDEED